MDRVEPDLPAIRLGQNDAQTPWGPPLLAKAEHASGLVAQRLGLVPPSPVTIVTRADKASFDRTVGGRPTHAIAMALGDRNTIVILRPAWAAASSAEQDRILVHELTHLALAGSVKGPLPRWLNEGLAMMTAREVSYGSSWRLALAGSLGGLIPLDRLANDMTFDDVDQTMAYAQSLSLTRFLLARDFPASPERPASLALALADPERGPYRVAQLWDPVYYRSLEIQWRSSNRSLFSWITALSGAGFLWAFTSGLFLLAYWRKRRMARLMRERFELEEQRDTELGLEPPPWEYEGDEDP